MGKHTSTAPSAPAEPAPTSSADVPTDAPAAAAPAESGASTTTSATPAEGGEGEPEQKKVRLSGAQKKAAARQRQQEQWEAKKQAKLDAKKAAGEGEGEGDEAGGRKRGKGQNKVRSPSRRLILEPLEDVPDPEMRTQGRKFDHRAGTHDVRLCNIVGQGRPCDRPNCNNDHDLAAFLSSRQGDVQRTLPTTPDDLTPTESAHTCPLYLSLGRCPYGFKCRLGESHMRKVADGEGFMGCGWELLVDEDKVKAVEAAAAAAGEGKAKLSALGEMNLITSMQIKAIRGGGKTEVRLLVRLRLLLLSPQAEADPLQLARRRSFRSRPSTSSRSASRSTRAATTRAARARSAGVTGSRRRRRPHQYPQQPSPQPSPSRPQPRWTAPSRPRRTPSLLRRTAPSPLPPTLPPQPPPRPPTSTRTRPAPTFPTSRRSVRPRRSASTLRARCGWRRSRRSATSPSGGSPSSTAATLRRPRWASRKSSCRATPTSGASCGATRASARSASRSAARSPKSSSPPPRPSSRAPRSTSSVRPPSSLSLSCAPVPSLTALFSLADINCGCPIDLVFNKGAGSALLAHAGKLGKSLVGMSKVLGEVPLTVKIRTGVSNSQPTAHKLMPRFQKEWGVSAVTVRFLPSRLSSLLRALADALL